MTRSVSAERVVHAPREAVFAYLADLETHWDLADRFIEVVSLERPPGADRAHGGVVRVRAPLGWRRTAETRVVDVDPPARLSGTADVGHGTRARVTWTLEPDGAATRVRLEALVERASRFDALLLAAGGCRWLRSRFAAILETLGQRMRK